jgi:TPR repeat protein
MEKFDDVDMDFISDVLQDVDSELLNEREAQIWRLGEREREIARENDVEAAKWYRSAAEQGDASAQHVTGKLYANGNGGPENDAEAVKWYRLSAEQGDADAQSNLGVMYATGNGVPENYLTAYVWWSVSAAQGHQLA